MLGTRGCKSKAGQGGQLPPRSLPMWAQKITHGIWPEAGLCKSIRQCLLNRCSWQNGYGFYTKSERHAPREDLKPEVLSSGVTGVISSFLGLALFRKVWAMPHLLRGQPGKPLWKRGPPYL